MENVTKEKILEIVSLILKNKEITTEQYGYNLSDFGMDSLKFVQIIALLEEKFDCEVPDTKLIITELNTINKIYDVLMTNFESPNGQD